MSRVAINRETGCWEWQGSLQHGYGQMTLFGKNIRVHKLMAFIFLGPAAFNPGTSVCHSCDNPRCCAPGHLFLGDAFKNRLDANMKGRHGKLTPDDALLARELFRAGWPDRSVAEVLDIARRTAGAIRHNLIWKQRATAHNKETI